MTVIVLVLVSSAGARRRLGAPGALGVSRASLYGKGDCVSDADAECFDRNRSTQTSGVTVEPYAFQNRPTFQQVVELTRRLPR